VADVQVAVRLGRKRVITLGMPADVGAGREIGFDDGAQEIGQRWRWAVFIVAHLI
jgi:hypothetical protein